ncbi:Cof-type HAD-IIB family hydrolase [Burkholderia gladioli]|uniref:Cof-type HAD-IIB family hydrolase n=1 Tax=Burkholderia gladioli TaxID=28095 RepID=UPI000D00B71D|nr:Cof-type HAD-IIB family hydrolase [Burkholderia gladioli]MBU9218166.1 Cof-type HAD-IIB family hydrolase [Burkholderia gladioli]MDN7726141.1 Cof-type HAD-IIB family hydrolase [Burkholderia gladioli]MDN7806870.1 Cof-type HAD-IIB family hydrolase [Burkholderia gladioli]MDN7922100.1 Cof-type HAD-IIB family hydrolase [Burkholderia gladioli]PRE92010.1 Cof-type HAD-IIB family hydrolase [Burkholderia gladioli]
MYHAICTDLDGTLLNRDHQLDPYTIDTVRRLAADGIPIIIATGRHHADVAGIRDVLGIRPYLITSNGARVHAPDDMPLYASDIAPAVVRELVRPELVGEHGRVIVNLFTDTGWLIDREAPHLLEFHQDSGFAYRVADLPAYAAEDVAKVLYIGEPADLAVLAERLASRFGDALYVTYSLPDCLEVMTAGVSKGRALRVVLERLGLDRAHCVAFGDNMNDIDLLETAGHPFMMDNANPDLVLRLPDVPRIGSNADSGVARHLRELFALDIDPVR